MLVLQRGPSSGVPHYSRSSSSTRHVVLLTTYRYAPRTLLDIYPIYLVYILYRTQSRQLVKQIAAAPQSLCSRTRVDVQRMQLSPLCRCHLTTLCILHRFGTSFTTRLTSIHFQIVYILLRSVLHQSIVDLVQSLSQFHQSLSLHYHHYSMSYSLDPQSCTVILLSLSFLAPKHCGMYPSCFYRSSLIDGVLLRSYCISTSYPASHCVSLLNYYSLRQYITPYCLCSIRSR